MVSPTLALSRCPNCGDVSFPPVARCKNPSCGFDGIEPISAEGPGRLASFTVQRFKPPPPFAAEDPFQPFGVGLVELDAGIMIMGRIVTDDVDSLRVGQRGRLVADPRASGRTPGWRIVMEAG